MISGLMSIMESGDPDDEDAAETEKELDDHMKEFEELMDRRPFLVNEVMLRRNPNDVQEWEKRIVLYGDNDEKVSELPHSENPKADNRYFAGRRNLHQSSHNNQSEESHSKLPHLVHQLREILRRRRR